MSTNRVTMRRIREALRLHLQAGLSYNEVGLALKISKSVVGKYVSLARVAGVDWDVAQTARALQVGVHGEVPGYRGGRRLGNLRANGNLNSAHAGLEICFGHAIPASS